MANKTCDLCDGIDVVPAVCRVTLCNIDNTVIEDAYLCRDCAAPVFKAMDRNIDLALRVVDEVQP